MSKAVNEDKKIMPALTERRVSKKIKRIYTMFTGYDLSELIGKLAPHQERLNELLSYMYTSTPQLE